MRKIQYTDEQINLFITGVYVGAINVFNLPKHLYFATADVLLHAFHKGIKQPIQNAKKPSIYTGPDKKMLRDLETNIYHFSASKTVYQVMEFQSLMVENNATLSLEKFKEKALSKWKVINETYLESEYITTLTASVSAMNFDYAVQNIEIFPRMKSHAIMDAETAPECARMNGVVADVEDPIWNHNISPRHFRCRCYEELIDAFSKEKSTGAWDKKRVIRLNGEDMSPEFKMNPAKSGMIFKATNPGKHPYFVVPKELKNLAKQNFNLPIPDVKTKKQ